MVSVESSRTKEKSRFARKYSLVENRLKETSVKLQPLCMWLIWIWKLSVCFYTHPVILTIKSSRNYGCKSFKFSCAYKPDPRIFFCLHVSHIWSYICLGRCLKPDSHLRKNRRFSASDVYECVPHKPKHGTKIRLLLQRYTLMYSFRLITSARRSYIPDFYDKSELVARLLSLPCISFVCLRVCLRCTGCMIF